MFYAATVHRIPCLTDYCYRRLFGAIDVGILVRRFRLDMYHQRFLRWGIPAIGAAPVGVVTVASPPLVIIVIEELVIPPGGIHHIPHVVPLGGLCRQCSGQERSGSVNNHGSLQHLDLSLATVNNYRSKSVGAHFPLELSSILLWHY
jgi:hypothetical protein